ncbi:MAG TPA: alkaline phosphatase family protein [Terriglobales bacterium]|nr:alkaline phosphatase family protein [Terriglobales bacterium]
MTQQFSATVSNTGNTTVAWSVNGISGGNAELGTISSNGLYTAPASVPTPADLTITAVSQADTTKSATASATVLFPQFRHVFLLMEENHAYADVIGNPSLPYLNSLATTYGLATNYFANTHPSIGNYFMLTTGQVITNDDTYNTTVDADNLVRQLIAAGKTWKSYAESLPSVGYTGGDHYPYLARHNPFSYFSDVRNSSSQALNLVPFTQLATDLANNQLPDFGYIIPNAEHDAHDCPDGTANCTDTVKLTTLDSWLQANIDPLIASPAFQQDGLLIITFDESIDSDTQHGGGHVPMLLISSKAKLKFQSATLFQHESTLRTLVEATGASGLPGASAGAADMGEFFP